MFLAKDSTKMRNAVAIKYNAGYNITEQRKADKKRTKQGAAKLLTVHKRRTGSKQQTPTTAHRPLNGTGEKRFEKAVNASRLNKQS